MGQVQSPPVLTQEALNKLPHEALRQGSRISPDLLLYRVGGEEILVKDFSRKAWLLRSIYGRLVTRQEARVLAALLGLEGVPQLRGRPKPYAVAMTYLPCSPVGKVAAQITGDERFIRELERIVNEMHARGVVHLDLRHRSNVVVSADGRPVVLDFATSLRFGRGRLGRLMLRLVAFVDRMALQNWKRRLCPEMLSPKELRQALLARRLRKLWLPRQVGDAFLAVFDRHRKAKRRQGEAEARGGSDDRASEP